MAFALAAGLFGAVFASAIAAFDDAGSESPMLGLFAVAAFGLSGGVSGALLGRRLARSRTAGGAMAMGAAVTLVAALLYVAAVLFVSIASTTDTVRITELRGIPVILGLAVVGALPAIPFGALAGWGAWSRVRVPR
ncbi:MAG: hypothetical protein AAGK21_08620 [Bacteroidota bacterium]